VLHRCNSNPEALPPSTTLESTKHNLQAETKN
jgi:hypothetical protein